MYLSHSVAPLILLIVATYSTAVQGDDIADALASAKRDFATRLEAEIGDLLLELKSRLATEKEDGNLAAVEATQAEIDAILKSRTLPKSISTKGFENTIKKARAELETSYRTAIKGYTKADQIELAKKVRDELSQFRKNAQSLQPDDLSTDKYVVISSPVSRKLVSVAAASTAAGALVIQWEPLELHAEMSWEFIPAEEGWFHIKNRKSGLVLAVGGGSKNDGANVIQWPLNKDGIEQQWRTVPFGPKAANAVMIENRNSSKFLSLENATTNNGERLVQSAAIANSRHQIWQIIPVK